jgi:translocation and assembly module TamA
LIQGTDPVLGSDIRFLQAQASAKLIHPFGKARTILRAEIGRLYVSDFNELPASLRFFTGGDKTVRGYDYNSLGPKDETGQIIGGRNLLIGSAEIDYRILPKWGAAVFYDIGGAFDRFEDRLNQSAGIGARWYSPVGPIRADIAYSLTEPGIILRLHINMGPDL